MSCSPYFACMKTLPLYFLALLVSLGTYAQDEFATKWNAAYELASAEKYDEALAAFEPLLTEQPSYSDTHVQMAWCYLIKGDMEEAGERAQTAFQLDPLNASVFAVNSYFLYVVGNNSGGSVFLNDAVWFTPDDANLPLFIEDVAKMKAAGLEVGTLESDLQAIIDGAGSRNRSYADIQDMFFKAVGQLNEGENATAKATFKEIFPLFEEVPEAQQRFVFNITYIVGTHYYSAGDSTNYLPLLTRTYEHMLENSKTSYVLLLHMGTLLSEHYYNIGEYEKAFEYASNGLTQYTFINAYRFLGSIKAQFLSQYAAAALAVGNLQEGRDAGEMISGLNYTGFDDWYEINGLIYMGHSWTDDDAKAQEYYRKAYDLAEASGYEDLKNDIAVNFK